MRGLIGLNDLQPIVHGLLLMIQCQLLQPLGQFFSTLTLGLLLGCLLGLNLLPGLFLGCRLGLGCLGIIFCLGTIVCLIGRCRLGITVSRFGLLRLPCWFGFLSSGSYLLSSSNRGSRNLLLLSSSSRCLCLSLCLSLSHKQQIIRGQIPLMLPHHDRNLQTNRTSLTVRNRNANLGIILLFGISVGYGRHGFGTRCHYRHSVTIRLAGWFQDLERSGGTTIW
mmetsp:Transcript_15946/g.34587  ORF Transcript_15946/g.34587 Transcript_15946/m.34587 type:complete len:223 (-) Transcript_15946:231-899(-)